MKEYTGKVFNSDNDAAETILEPNFFSHSMTGRPGALVIYREIAPRKHRQLKDSAYTCLYRLELIAINKKECRSFKR